MQRAGSFGFGYIGGNEFANKAYPFVTYWIAVPAQVTTRTRQEAFLADVEANPELYTLIGATTNPSSKNSLIMFRKEATGEGVAGIAEYPMRGLCNCCGAQTYNRSSRAYGPNFYYPDIYGRICVYYRHLLTIEQFNYLFLMYGKSRRKGVTFYCDDNIVVIMGNPLNKYSKAIKANAESRTASEEAALHTISPKAQELHDRYLQEIANVAK